MDSLAAGEPKVRAAGTSVLTQFAGNGWIAIGDAAIALDPLSSQGVLAALESSSAALNAIQTHLSGFAHGMQQYIDLQRDAARRLLRQRQRLYDVEKRWLLSAFWRRRSLYLPAFAL
jgi:flavin-dependent dehydrogenase